MIRNTAGQRIGIQGVSATTGAAFTSPVTVYVTGNAGAQAIGSVASGVCTHHGNGYHTYAPAQGETNYAMVAYTFVGTGMIPQTVQVYPSFPQTGDAFPAAAASQAAAENLQTRVPVALSGSLMACDALTVDSSAVAAQQLADALIGGSGIPVDVQTWRGVVPNMLVAGRVDVDAGDVSLPDGSITAATITGDFFNGMFFLLSADATVPGSVFKLIVDKLTPLMRDTGIPVEGGRR